MSPNRAENLLALVLPRERAAAAVGDLLESASGRTRWSLWTSTGRLFATVVADQIAGSPFALLASAAVGWLVYMTATVVLMLPGMLAALLAWGVTSFFSNHTAVELVTGMFGISIGWPPTTLQLAHVVQPLVMWIAAPYAAGRLAARFWPEREVTIAVMLMLAWPALAMWAPLVIMPDSWSVPGRADLQIATGTSASIVGIASMLFFVWCGAVRERHAWLRRTSSAG